MRGILKDIKLISDDGHYGFEARISTESGVKTFGGLADSKSFRKLFFGLLVVCNNFDISDLACVKGKRVACLFEHPDSLEQKIAAVGSGSKFLVYDDKEGYVTKKIDYKTRKLMKSVNAIQNGRIAGITSSSLTIWMTFEFKYFSQGVSAPRIFVGMGYPLVTSPLTPEYEEYAGKVSDSYIVEFMNTVLRTEYLYDERVNDNRYYVQCEYNEDGEIVSLGNTVYIEGIEHEVFINKYGSEYKLEEEPIKRNVKSIKSLEVKKRDII